MIPYIIMNYNHKPHNITSPVPIKTLEINHWVIGSLQGSGVTDDGAEEFVGKFAWMGKGREGAASYIVLKWNLH